MLDTEKTDLKRLLTSVDCETYLPNFEKFDITPDLIPSLDRESIKELGVTKVGDRLRLQILVQLSRLDRIKREIPIESLNNSIGTAINNVARFNGSVAEELDKQRQKKEEEREVAPGDFEHFIEITIISQDGKQNRVEMNSAYGGVDMKKQIVSAITGNDEVAEAEWRLYCLDYENQGHVHEIKEDELVAIVLNKRPEKERLILCKGNESVNLEAINTSNKIKIKTSARMPHERVIKPFMGGRPPSQLISTNLRDYFPDLGNLELEDIKRKSVRMSVYSNKIMNRISRHGGGITGRDSLYSRLSSISMSSSRMSMISSFSYGVGVPLTVSQPENRLTGGDDVGTLTAEESIVDEHPNSIIELLDESDEEDVEGAAEEDVDGLEPAEEHELRGIIDREVSSGPSLWHKGPKIGQGSFGNVYLGLNGLTGELMAIKQVDMPSNESEKSKKLMVNALKQEISLLKDLSHENIVRYLGSNEDASHMYIFLEYIPGGSVSSMLKMYGPFEEELIRNFTRQVLVGLAYLHSRGIIHRDIKGGNILVDNTGSVKIGDFGISKRVAEDGPPDGDGAPAAGPASAKSKRSSLQGSVFWMAPEVVKQVAYTDKADVWSVGCLVVEMYTGKHPYPALSPMQAIFQIGTGRASPAVPQRACRSALDFLSRVFNPDYLSRDTALGLLKTEFVSI